MVLLGFLSNWRVLVVIAGLLGLLVGYFMIEGKIWRWWTGVDKIQAEGREALKELGEVKQEREVLQAAVRQLSKQVKVLTENANAERARAEREAAARRKSEGEIAALAAGIRDLNARPALPPINSLREGAAFLRARGL